MNAIETHKPADQVITDGIIAGFAATLPMTIVMIAGHTMLPWTEKYPLPPRQIVENLTKRTGTRKHLNDSERQALTWMSHFGFGATTGVLYSALANRFPFPPLFGGLVYGMLVWGASYMGWLPAAQILPPASKHPANRNIIMIVAHLVWGTTLAFLIHNQQKHQGESS
jgi:uncharacterized membrane protein YagU involved in acid resistance